MLKFRETENSILIKERIIYISLNRKNILLYKGLNRIQEHNLQKSDLIILTIFSVINDEDHQSILRTLGHDQYGFNT